MESYAVAASSYANEFVAGLFDGFAVEVVFLEEGMLPIYRKENGEQDVADLELVQITLPTAEGQEKMGQCLRDELLKLRSPDSNTVYIRSADFAEINNKLFTFAQLFVGFACDKPVTENESATS